MSEAKLKPCEWCGGTNIEPQSDCHPHTRGCCQDCGAKGPTAPTHGKTWQEAWNTRASRAIPDIDKAAEEINEAITRPRGDKESFWEEDKKQVVAILTNLCPGLDIDKAAHEIRKYYGYAAPSIVSTSLEAILRNLAPAERATDALEAVRRELKTEINDMDIDDTIDAAIDKAIKTAKGKHD